MALVKAYEGATLCLYQSLSLPLSVLSRLRNAGIVPGARVELRLSSVDV